MTVDTKQSVAPYYITRSFLQLAKVLKAYAQQEHVQFDDQMALLPYFMTHDTTDCFNYLEVHYSELAEKLGFQRRNAGQAVYRW